MELKETEAKATYSKMIHLVIDADSLIYRAAHAGEKEFNANKIPVEHVLFTEMPLLSMREQQKEIFHSMIGGIVWKIREDLNAKGIDIEEYTLLFTPKKDYCEANELRLNFRYEIVDQYNELHEEDAHHPQYKASRKGMQLPEGIPELFKYALALENIIASDHCEADDVAHKLKVEAPDDVVIACLDKDIYEGTPSGDLGHYNFNRNEWHYTTQEEAHLFFYRQCMTGDSSDGIKGIHRFGPKAAEKTLPEFTDHEDMWDTVVNTFQEKGYTEEYALLMMRLVNLGQLTNDGIALWQPPILSEVIDGPEFYDNQLPVSTEDK